MKKIFIISAFLFFFLPVFAQEASQTDIKRFNVNQDTKVAFRLFPTANAWNHLLLDTRTGQIWGVQISLNNINQIMKWVVDDTHIESATKENVGRFTLYPTTNNYNFILLDQTDGRMWQVQFSLDNSENNFKIRIN